MDDIDWVEIPAGVLIRGTPVADIDAITAAHADLQVQRGWIAKEAPRTEVAVAAFAISRTPVTVAQWSVFAAAAGWGGGAAVTGPPDHPVDGLGWAAAVAFCSWLAARTGLPVRLPTETEWERAARGGDDREYPWGDHYTPECANLADAGVGTITTVGSFPRGASPFGLLDLAGNVDEWTDTRYAPYSGAPGDVPSVEDWAADPHITRGGSFHHGRDLARCARRHGVYPPLRGAGFRVAV